VKPPPDPPPPGASPTEPCASDIAEAVTAWLGTVSSWPGFGTPAEDKDTLLGFRLPGPPRLLMAEKEQPPAAHG